MKCWEIGGIWIFQILQHGKIIGKVSKEWFTWGDSYKVQIIDEQMETLIIAIVVAIDCVKSEEVAATASV